VTVYRTIFKNFSQKSFELFLKSIKIFSPHIGFQTPKNSTNLGTILKEGNKI